MNAVDNENDEEGTWLIDAMKGLIQKNTRYVSILKFPHDLRRFPFDSGKIDIILESRGRDITQLNLIYLSPNDGVKPDYVKIKGQGFAFNDDFKPHPEWSVLGLDGIVKKHTYNASFSRAVTTIGIRRKTAFYWYKILLPLAIIPFFGFSMFLFKPDNYSEKLGVVTDMLLTVFAFLWVISGDLPKAGYLVSLDWLIITTLLILVLLYVSILADWYMVVWAKTDIYTIRTIDFFVCVTLAVVYVVIFIALFLWYECCTCCSSSSRKKKKRSPKVKKKVKPLS